MSKVDLLDLAFPREERGAILRLQNGLREQIIQIALLLSLIRTRILLERGSWT